MEPWAQVISQVGFPIGIAVYLLSRFEKRLDRLAQTSDKLAERIEGLSQSFENCRACPWHKGQTAEEMRQWGKQLAGIIGGER